MFGWKTNHADGGIGFEDQMKHILNKVSDQLEQVITKTDGNKIELESKITFLTEECSKA